MTVGCLGLNANESTRYTLVKYISVLFELLAANRAIEGGGEQHSSKDIRSRTYLYLMVHLCAQHTGRVMMLIC